TTLSSPQTTLFPYTTLFRSYETEFATLLQSSATERRNKPPLSSPLSINKPNFKTINLFDSNTNLKPSRHKRETLIRFLFILGTRSEEHTSELQSRFDLVCRL